MVSTNEKRAPSDQIARAQAKNAGRTFRPNFLHRDELSVQFRAGDNFRSLGGEYESKPERVYEEDEPSLLGTWIL